MRLRWMAVVVAVSLSLGAPLFAQTAGENERALALGHEGIDLYNKGDWTEAQRRFAEADRLAHSPVFVLYLARSARNAGDLAGAKEAYDRLARESVPEGAPAPWIGAVASGKQEGAELQKRLMEAQPSPSASALPSASMPVATAMVTAPALGPRPAASAGMNENPPDWMNLRPYVPALAMVGVGVIGLGVGTGLFVHAKSMADDVLSRCEGDVCPASDAQKKDSAVNFANGSAVATALGGAALATGLVLVWVLDPRRNAPVKASAGQKSSSGATGTLTIEPGFAAFRLSGAF